MSGRFNSEFDLLCGCDFTDNGNDIDNDGFADCIDLCPEVPMEVNVYPVCGCGVPEDLSDEDEDGIPACLEDCEDSVDEGCGCGISDCTGVNGVLLTPKSKISKVPVLNNERKNGSTLKRKVRFSLKNFIGARVDISSFPLAERRKKRNTKEKVRYTVILSKVKGDKIRRVKRIVSKKALTRLIRLKDGKYTVKYKALIKRKKKTVSKTNYSPSRSFNVPLS